MITFEFDGLEELVAAVELVSARGMDEVAEDISEEAVDLSKHCFETDEDPYGAGWDPWKYPPTRPHVKLMVETGALRDSIDAIEVSRSGFTLGSFGAVGWDGRDHAHYHQEGTAIMVARPFLPDFGMPIAWLPDFIDVFEDTFRRLIGD